MQLMDILSDKHTKRMEKRQLLAAALRAGSLSLAALQEADGRLTEQQLSLVLEAMEEVTNKQPDALAEGYVAYAIPHISSPNNACKREASRIVGNMAAAYPAACAQAVPALLANTQDAGTVVRWGSAYALSRLVVLKAHAQSTLYDTLLGIMEAEQDNGVKNQYVKALRRAQKLRS